MAAKLSPAVQVTGPNDALLANDGRGATPQGTIAKAQPSPTPPSGIQSAFEIAKPLSGKLVEALVVDKLRNPGLSDAQAAQGLERSVGTRLVSLYGTATDSQIPMGNAIDAFKRDVTGRDPTKLLDASGRVIDVWDRADPGKVTSLSQSVLAITRIGGATGIVDVKGRYAAALGLLDQALALGVPQLIDDILQYVKVNKEAKRRLIENVRGVIMRSDHRTLNKILDWVGSEGVLQRVPDAIPLILTFYRFEWGVRPEHYPQRRRDLLAVLGRVKPNWNESLRGTQNVSDLTATNYMSAASKTLLTLLEPGTNDSNYFEQPYLLEATMAGAYPFQDLQRLSNSLYPELAAWGGNP